MISWSWRLEWVVASGTDEQHGRGVYRRHIPPRRWAAFSECQGWESNPGFHWHLGFTEVPIWQIFKHEYRFEFYLASSYRMWPNIPFAMHSYKIPQPFPHFPPFWHLLAINGLIYNIAIFWSQFAVYDNQGFICLFIYWMYSMLDNGCSSMLHS